MTNKFKEIARLCLKWRLPLQPHFCKQKWGWIAMTIKRLPRSLWSLAMTNRTTIFLIVVLLVSFSWHIYHRNDHFQECDSSAAYPILHSINLTHNDISTRLDKMHLEKNNFKNNLVYLRLLMRKNLLELKIPEFIKNAFGFPFVSTYSFGSGLVYSIISPSYLTYEQFMSNGMIITQILFHLSVILLFLILIRLGINQTVALITSLLLLFSISMYSYGYHLGNTVWNYSTAFLWLFFLVINLNHPKLLKRISWLTSLLIFFNYLILFYWLAFLMTYIYENQEKKEEFTNNKVFKIKKILTSIIPNSKFLIRVVKSQWSAILMIIVVAGLFYPPGQGNRGSTSIITFPTDFYYVILNFFSFYNHNKIIDALQFIIGLVLTALGLFYIFKKNLETKLEFSILKKTLIFLISLFIVSVVMGLLGFAPTRHILFLSPLIFLSVGIAIDRLITNKFNRIIVSIFLVFIVFLGFISLNIRTTDSLAKSNFIKVSSKIKKIFITYCATDLIYKDWKIPTELAEPNLLKLGGPYLYLSKFKDFDQALSEWHNGIYNLKTSNVTNYKDVSDVYFIAYPKIEAIGFSDPSNSIYASEFTVSQISKLKP